MSLQGLGQSQAVFTPAPVKLTDRLNKALEILEDNPEMQKLLDIVSSVY